MRFLEFGASLLPAVFSTVFGLLNVQLISARVGLEAVGLVALAQATSALGIQIVFGPMSQAVFRYAARADITRRELISVINPVLFGSAIAFSILGFVAGELLYLPLWLEMGLIHASLYSVTLCVHTLFFGSGRRLLGGTVGALEPLFRYIVNYLFLPIESDTTLPLINFGVSALLAAVGPAIVLLIPHRVTERRSSIFREMAIYAWPFAAWGTIAAVGSQADRFILAGFLTNTDLAFYAVALGLSNGLWATLTNGAINYTASSLYAASVSPNQTSAIVWRLQTLFIMLVLCVSVAFIPIADAVFELILGQAPAQSIILTLISLAVGVFQTGQLVTLRGQKANKVDIYLFAKVAHAGLSVSLGIAACLYFGLTGVAIAACITSFVYLLLLINANSSIK
jgi:O-antigen/teichoic acid export membrane protein